MIFPQYGYKKFDESNKEQWPEDWLKMVNDARTYCREKAEMFDFIGKCKAAELPSEHPYWTLHVKLRHAQFLEGQLNSLESTNSALIAAPNHSLAPNMLSTINSCQVRITELLKKLSE